jgi:hypothetical protein
MTEPDLERLWSVVPIGEANAAAASTIWKSIDMYSRSTIRYQLSWMVDAGRIRRTSRRMPIGGEVHLYYRAQDE